MTKNIKYFSFFLCVVVCFTIIGCSTDDSIGSFSGDIISDNAVIKTGSELKYSSSDKTLAAFLNDFYSRHVRNGTDKIGSVQLGRGETYQKLWEMDSVVWFDSTIDGLGTYDAMENIKSYLSSIDIDRFGSVFSSPNIAHEENARAYMGWGWPFPGYSDYNNNGVVSSDTYGVNFGSDSFDWTVNGSAGVTKGGNLDFSFSGGKNQTLVLQSGVIGENGEGVDTSFYSPVIQLEMRIEDLSSLAGVGMSDIEDYYICWRTTEGRKNYGDDYWFSVSQKEFAANPQDFESYTMFNSYFPMYLNENWDGEHVTDIRIEIVPQSGKKLTLNGKINYLYFMGDNVNSVNAGNYIASLEKYVYYNNDTDFLVDNITKARQAILFQMYALQGKDGLIDLSYLRGHSLSQGGGYYNQNGFWDMYPTGNKNTEANVYFYIALKSLAKLEGYLSAAGVSVDTVASVDDPYYSDGAESIVYNETEESLNELAEIVKENICKSVSEGGFWNPETGRFAWAVYDENPRIGEEGEAMDYGHTVLNLLIITEGIATQEQIESILSWLDGERIVEGDDSTGDDIYMYEFGPRTTTKNNTEDHNSMWTGTTWANSCQNGGICLFSTYYDLLARNASFGVEDAYERLKAIENWYYDVWSYDGDGAGFYDEYYMDKQSNTTDGNSSSWTLQGGGSSGAVGIVGEFYESALLYASVPQIFFGLSASDYKTLTITPNLPDNIEWFALENLMYSGVKYDCYIQNNTVLISGVRGEVDGETMNIRIKKTKSNFTVKINGQATNNWRESDGYIIINVPLANVVVTVE